MTHIYPLYRAYIGISHRGTLVGVHPTTIPWNKPTSRLFFWKLEKDFWAFANLIHMSMISFCATRTYIQPNKNKNEGPVAENWIICCHPLSPKGYVSIVLAIYSNPSPFLNSDPPKKKKKTCLGHSMLNLFFTSWILTPDSIITPVTRHHSLWAHWGLGRFVGKWQGQPGRIDRSGHLGFSSYQEGRVQIDIYVLDC